MTWVKVDDHFSEHPKAVAVGLAGQGLYVAGLCYCNRQLTDGDITMPALVVISGLAVRAARTLADRLVEVGLWERTPTGYRVHDYLRYQDSRAKVMAKREADLQRKRGGIPKESEGNPQGIRTDSNGSPPTPLIGSSYEEPKTQKRARARSLEEADIAECCLRFPGVNVGREAEKYRDWLLQRGNPHKDQVAGFRNWLRRREEEIEKARLTVPTKVGGVRDFAAETDAFEQRLRGGSRV